MNFDWKQLTPHLICLGIFLLLSFGYFSPVISGKQILQGDILQYKGMSKEIVDYKEKTGKKALWTNSMFSGMPAYQIRMISSTNIVYYLDKLLRIFPHPAGAMFLCFAGFYLMLILLGVNPWLSLLGAIGYGFSTYNFLILEAGHNSKFVTMAYMAPVVAGVIMAFRGKWLIGGVIFAFALALNINANHPQITYYLFILLLIYGIIEFINAIRAKTLPEFAKTAGILVIGAILALGVNTTRTLATWQYSKDSIRGASELKGEGKGGSGLDYDYAMAWSYGKMETMTLLIPRFMGGASGEPLTKDMKLYKAFKQGKESVGPMYWGPMPFTGGPIYHGAIICFLFVLGCFLVKGPMKWWLLAATILSIMLAWGKNFTPLTDLFFYFFPMYNKFRVVSMMLTIAQFTMPMLGVIGLNQLLHKDTDKKASLMALKIAAGSVVALLAIFILFGGSLLEFESARDARFQQVLSQLIADRQSMMRTDAIRSLVLVLIAAGLVWAWIQEKIKPVYVIAALTVLTLGDLWQVNQRYLDSSNFKSPKKIEQRLAASKADKSILQDKDPHYRVLNLASDPFNNGTTSYHHKSIGGYHGAKLRRYQDMIEYHISSEIQALQGAFQSSGGDVSKINTALSNQHILNMLNTKYYIYNPEAPPLTNASALGNAWIVGDYQIVPDANAAITTMKGIKPTEKMVIEQVHESFVKGKDLSKVADANIKLTKYAPDELSYSFNASKEQLVIFSEVYYDKGWQAYIDGKPADHFRANYILRGMTVPAGSHTIDFKFEPAIYTAGETISLISSVLLLLMIGAAVYRYRNPPIEVIGG